MPLIFAIVVVALIAGAVVWIGSTGWLVRSGLEDLARRRRLLRGIDPLQLTAQQALGSARRSYALAFEALGATVDAWYDLRETQGIGTALEVVYPEIQSKVDPDPRFRAVLEQANETTMAGPAQQPDSVADLLEEAARIDAMTLEIRTRIHRARPPRRRGPGALFR